MNQKKKIDLFNVDCPSFMMVMPTNASSENNNNVWMQQMSEEDKVMDPEATFGQWMDLYNFLSFNGIVAIAPSPANIEGLADHVYAANSGIMIKDTYVVSNFTSEPRQPETPIIEKFMRNFGCKVVVCPFKFEGEADMKYIGKLNNKDTFVAGYGIRSTKEAYDWMEKEFDINIIQIEMKDEALYHFDCMLFNLTASNDLDKTKANVMACIDVMSKSDIEKLRKYCHIIEVPKKLADYGITNCVRCGSYVLCGSDLDDMDPDFDGEVYYTERDKTQFLEDVLSDFGMEPVFINLSEFFKAGACLSCNVCHLNRFSYDIETV